jgi:hypothetical protein
VQFGHSLLKNRPRLFESATRFRVNAKKLSSKAPTLDSFLKSKQKFKKKKEIVCLSIGVNVMITIFGKFCLYFGDKIGVFCVVVIFSSKIVKIGVKIANSVLQIFGQEVF